MAKYNQNHSEFQKALDKAKSLIKPSGPIVIPRDKLELAHLKVRNSVNKMKIMGLIIIIEFVVITCLLVK